MSALTKDSPQIAFEATLQPGGILKNSVVASASVVFQGSHVCIDGSGYTAVGADTSGFIYLGQSVSPKATGAADGSVKISVQLPPRYGVFTASSPTQAWIGTHAFLADDSGVVVQAGSSTNKVIVGRIIYIDPDGVSVIVDTYDKYALATT
jgi:hypothetical protein